MVGASSSRLEFSYEKSSLTELKMAKVAAREGSKSWPECRLLEAPLYELLRSGLQFSQPTSTD